MATQSSSQEVIFAEIREKASKLTQGVVESVLQKRVYNSKEVQNWINQMTDNIVKALTDFNKNFKYMVTCVIMQKNDAGLNVYNTCYWNSQVDGYCTVQWENPSMVCIVNVYAVGL